MLRYLLKNILLDIVLWNIRVFIGSSIFLILGLKPRASMYAGASNKSDMFGCGYFIIGKYDESYAIGNETY